MSLMELVNTQYCGAAQAGRSRLTEEFRFNSNILQFPNKYFYNSQLRANEKVKDIKLS